ncbi:MAG: NUDIX domain-containing protein [Candidatus Nanohaloarchaea archaeon]
MVDRFRMATKALIEKDGKLLFLKEAESYEEGTNADKWQIPGGRLEPGENYFKALRREVREETGLEIEINEPVAVDEWRPEIKEEKWQIVGVFFRCSADSEEVELSGEHTDYIWLEPDRHQKIDMIGNLEEIMKSYNERRS